MKEVADIEVKLLEDMSGVEINYAETMESRSCVRWTAWRRLRLGWSGADQRYIIELSLFFLRDV